jgi:hypothetical protein
VALGIPEGYSGSNAPPANRLGGVKDSAARATALAFRTLAQASRAIADWQRRRAAVLRDLADAYLAEADTAADQNGTPKFLREYAAQAIRMADAAEADAKTYAHEAERAVTKAQAADQRALTPP